MRPGGYAEAERFRFPVGLSTGGSADRAVGSSPALLLRSRACFVSQAWNPDAQETRDACAAWIARSSLRFPAHAFSQLA